MPGRASKEEGARLPLSISALMSSRPQADICIDITPVGSYTRSCLRVYGDVYYTQITSFRGIFDQLSQLLEWAREVPEHAGNLAAVRAEVGFVPPSPAVQAVDTHSN